MKKNILITGIIIIAIIAVFAIANPLTLLNTTTKTVQSDLRGEQPVNTGVYQKMTLESVYIREMDKI